MKILIVGTFPAEDGTIEIGQFLQKTCDSMRTALQKSGHSVDMFHYRKEEERNRKWGLWEYRLRKYCRRWFQKKKMPRIVKTLMFRLPGTKSMNQNLLQIIKEGHYDFVLLAKAELIDYTMIPLYRQYTHVWYYFTDWLPIARKIQAEEYARVVDWASATRTTVTDFFKQAGGNALFLTQGANTDIFYPAENATYEYDVVFVGTLRDDRKRYLDYIRSHGMRVATFGKDMDFPHVFGKDLADVYRKAKIVLNFNTTINKSGFSLRVFEVMGCGAFLLTEHCTDLERLFVNRQELVWFGSPEECLREIKTYMDDEVARKAIAMRGLQSIRDSYTWTHIMNTMCDIVAQEKTLT